MPYCRRYADVSTTNRRASSSPRRAVSVGGDQGNATADGRVPSGAPPAAGGDPTPGWREGPKGQSGWAGTVPPCPAEKANVKQLTTTSEEHEEIGGRSNCTFGASMDTSVEEL